MTRRECSRSPLCTHSLPKSTCVPHTKTHLPSRFTSRISLFLLKASHSIYHGVPSLFTSLVTFLLVVIILPSSPPLISPPLPITNFWVICINTQPFSIVKNIISYCLAQSSFYLLPQVLCSCPQQNPPKRQSKLSHFLTSSSLLDKLFLPREQITVTIPDLPPTKDKRYGQVHTPCSLVRCCIPHDFPLCLTPTHPPSNMCLYVR